MARKVLGISWLHGQFQAVSLTGDIVSASWASPQPVEDEAAFGAALAQAVRETHFDGLRVAVVLDHRNLLFHVQETPPAKGRVLRQLLARLVAQNHFFEGRVAWGHSTLPSNKEKQRHLLALLPEALVTHLKAACESRRLQLVSIQPFAALFGNDLRQLGVPAGETVVLAVDGGGSLNLLLGLGDGRILFSRSVQVAGAQRAERAAQEINRTLHYAQQQFGATVNQIFVVGQETYDGLKDMEIRQGLRIQQSPATDVPFAHAKKGAALPPKSTWNFLSPADSGRRVLRQWAAAAALALLAGAIVVTAKVELAVRASERQVDSRLRQVEDREREHGVELVRETEARRLHALLHLAGSTNDPPVPELFARHLAVVLPETLRLTQLTVVRSTNGWEFTAEGFAREHTAGLLERLEAFEQTLSAGLFRPQITDSTRRSLFAGGPPDRPAALKNKESGAGEKPFFVTGVIR